MHGIDNDTFVAILSARESQLAETQSVCSLLKQFSERKDMELFIDIRREARPKVFGLSTGKRRINRLYDANSPSVCNRQFRNFGINE